MKRLLFFILSATFCAAGSHAQGWELVGPDSTNWRNVARISVKWTSPSSYKLAAAANYNGIALYTAGGQWEYPLKTWYDPYWGTGMGYYYFEFSPWEDSAAFIGYAHFYTEPAYYIVKGSYLGIGTAQPTNSGCWVTPLSVIIPPNSDSLVFASACGIQRSSNRGESWDTVSGQSWSIAYANLLAFNERLGHILYKSDMSSSNHSVVYRSTNRGGDWDSIFSATPEYSYNAESPYSVIAVGDTVIVAVSAALYDTTRVLGIFRSIDGGGTWSHVIAGFGVAGLARSHQSETTLYAASQQGVITSSDMGATWAAYNVSLPTTSLTSLVVSPFTPSAAVETLFVSTQTHGVLKVWAFTVGVDDGVQAADQFRLEQNYPNPFNPSTSIKYQIPSTDHVTLMVFDVLGREVATLVNEVKQPGTHEVRFDSSRLSSGVYYYRMTTSSGFNHVQKMVILR